MFNTRRLGLACLLAVLTAAAAPAAIRTDLLGGTPRLPLVAVKHYTLVRGDTVTSVAQNHGLEIDTILAYNKIKSPRLLKAGMTLKLPSRDGILISLDTAQPVAALSTQFQIFAPLLLQANGLPEGTTEIEGSVFLPGAKLDTEGRRKYLGELFAWPTVGGRISSYFGRRNDPFTGKVSNHSGVDIAVAWGTPVLAAGNGVVTYTGYNSILGNHIQVDQGQGYTVVYGHLSAILTRPGRRVLAGQPIGRVGSTGYSTGPHLHFTAYRWNRLLNPMTLFS